MSIKIYFCINKTTKEVLSAGILPDVWGSITGMSNLSDEDAADLSWAGYPEFGFLLQDEALTIDGITTDKLTAALSLSETVQIEYVKAKQFKILSESDWRVIKSIESGIQLAPEWSNYRNSIRNVNLQSGYPWDITWPIPPI